MLFDRCSPGQTVTCADNESADRKYDYDQAPVEEAARASAGKTYFLRLDATPVPLAVGVREGTGDLA
jgi:hypothetical protein